MTVSGADIAHAARKALGVQYVWGGNSLTSGIDCSGLVQQVYRQFGIDVPRVTYDQINTGADVPVNKLQPGDLVFFDTDTSKKGPDHVGIYLGGGKFIHAPRPGQGVKISSLTDSYYLNRWLGGRRIAGVDASASVDATAPVDQSSPHRGASELAESYGMSYAFFKSQPELMGLLKSAVGEQWTGGVFQAKLKNTKWWKENSSSARQAQVQKETDPATYRASLEAARVSASQAAVKLGAILTAKQTQQLATNMVDYGWNEAQVQNFLGQYVDFTANHTLGGQAGAAAKQIRQGAYDNGIQVSDQTVKNQAAYLVRGLTSMEDIQGGLRAQAVSMYPGFADQITAGASMRDLAQPYTQMAAKELELPETDVDLFHPKVRGAIQRRDDKGLPAPMSLTDYAVSLRNDPAWKRTAGAQDQAMQVGRQVLTSMGLVS